VLGQGFKHPEMFNAVATHVVETAQELQLSKVCFTVSTVAYLLKELGFVLLLIHYSWPPIPVRFQRVVGCPSSV
jgi:hypothetical protein